MSQRRQISQPLEELLTRLKPQSLQLLSESERSEFTSFAQQVKAAHVSADEDVDSVGPRLVLLPPARLLPFERPQAATTPLERLRVFRPDTAATVDRIIGHLLAAVVPPDRR